MRYYVYLKFSLVKVWNLFRIVGKSMKSGFIVQLRQNAETITKERMIISTYVSMKLGR